MYTRLQQAGRLPMTEITFHLINNNAADAFWYHAAELCAERAENEQLTYVVCANHEHADGFDEYLWGYRSDRFVPHTADPDDAEFAPVFIGTQPAAGGFNYVINLSGKVIDQPAKRTMIDEIIPADDKARTSARERWRHYKTEGINPVHRAVGADTK